MPTDPTAHFVVIETDFAFGFFEHSFDGPTHAADADQFHQGCVGWGIAEVEFDLGRVVKVTTQDQPEFRAWQVIARFCDAQKGEVTNDGTFAAFFDGCGGPVILGDQGDQMIDTDGAVCRVTQPQASWATPSTLPRWDMNGGSGTPDQGRASDFGGL